MTGFVLVATLSLTGAAKAQSSSSRIRANIPFDFIVGNTKLPGGEYLIRRANTNGDTFVLITSVRGRASIFRVTTAIFTANPNNPVRLVFHRYGDQYFLSEIWPSAGGNGRRIPESSKEREARVHISQNVMSKTVETVVVAAYR